MIKDHTSSKAGARAAALLLVLLLTGAACQNKPPTAAFVGNSLTLGAASKDHYGFVGYASSELGWRPERHVWYHLADTILLLDDVGRVDILVLEVGAHTLTTSDRLAAIDENVFRRYYGLLLDKASRHARTVIALSIPWLNWSDAKCERAQRYNEIIREEAGKRGVLYVDIWTPLQSCGRECLGEDKFHPNDKGHVLIAGELVKAYRSQ